jgi:hypothetical protein
MISALKAEFRKLFSIRSTYFILFLALAMNILIAGYAHGYRMSAQELKLPTQLVDSMQVTVTITVIFSALIAVLLISHEYRYNTILYSLVAKRRSTFLLSKFITVSFFGIIFAGLMALLAAIFTYIGVHIAGNTLAAQSLPYHDFVWRILFYGWGYSVVALLIGFLVRNQVGSIMALFLIPTTVEGLLSILLKDKVSYLPFSSLGSVLDQSKVLTYGKAAMVFCLYMIIGWLVAWFLIYKRDAN